MRYHGGEIREEKSGMINYGGGIIKEKSWRRDHGGEIIKEKSWRRNTGGETMDWPRKNLVWVVSWFWYRFFSSQ